MHAAHGELLIVQHKVKTYNAKVIGEQIDLYCIHTGNYIDRVSVYDIIIMDTLPTAGIMKAISSVVQKGDVST